MQCLSSFYDFYSLFLRGRTATRMRISPPAIIHSDHGSEYTPNDYIALTQELGIAVSMSKKVSPWENGYQESFYSQFKVDLGNPNRFQNLGELV